MRKTLYLNDLATLRVCSPHPHISVQAEKVREHRTFDFPITLHNVRHCTASHQMKLALRSRFSRRCGRIENAMP